jgi:hypothetical protein
MAVLTRSLGDRENWQIGLASKLSGLRGVSERHRRNSVNDFLASGPWTSGKGNPRRPVVGHVPEHS